MTKEQFERQKNYSASMAVARALFSKGLINEREYRKIDTNFKKKYRPVVSAAQAKKP